MHSRFAGPALGLDFGTTNSVAAVADGDGAPELIGFGSEADAIFRSALCFWHDEGAKGGLAVEAGPFAIAEYLEYPEDSRFLQSFKSVAASASFESASVFEKRYRFEELGRFFLARLAAHAGDRLQARPRRLVVGRPVQYAGARPDAALARSRYDAMFEGFADEIHYVYEPIGAAFSHAARLTEPTTLLVADFGGGTSDFSIVAVAEPGAGRRCTPLGHAGIGIAGDRFDYRIVDRLVLPMLGKGGHYRSFGKEIEIPRGYFTDFADWSRLALMRNRRTMDELRRLQRDAVDGAAIGRMIAVIENELGYPLYDAVGRLKRALSTQDRAHFHFSGAGLEIEADVRRETFESWIAEDVSRIDQTIDRALADAGLGVADIDTVFLTGGTSLIPMVRALFERRFGARAIMSGGELTSIAHGLALIAQEQDPAQWAA
ncbi:Hsp70 family protein [Sphingosinicella sp. BN140058]|uniref:Hsp70 family protein n=1 Tax=Sphingosinicella sp. BN140058 TaxID=1892855 RepID=UPI0010101653|nr:Hsp70 family protein [Sphingosinicella sp. BN140058]QAY75502.1 Hsp70 family protein [Sphingosinicella sp. BN140058]